MNMQALVKQAQKLQQDMLKAKEELDNTEFEGENSFVKVVVKGNKELVSVKIDAPDSIDKEDLEMLEDMILVATNEAMKKVDDATEQKMGKYGNSLPGMF